MSKPNFPHGVCECPTASGLCCGGCGPIAYEVTRNGKRLRLCTRCDLPGDIDRVLLVSTGEPADLYWRFDALGAFCILGELRETKEVP